MINVKHWDHVLPAQWHWKNFTPREMACSHCNALILDEEAMNRLQAARWDYGRSIIIARAYSCEEHNIAVGGAKDSAHPRGTAFDPYPATSGNLAEMLESFYKVGWLGYGMGAGKLHFDYDLKLGKRAWYYGK